MVRNEERRCLRCYLPSLECICDRLPKVRARTQLLVVQHVLEMHKTSNTARLALLSLPGSLLIPYGGKDQPFEETLLEAPGTFLLYPDGEAAQLAETPRRLVVVDASWSQSRRMVQRVPALRKLPRVSLPPPSRESDRIRRPPREEGMSSLEAIAHALQRLEGDAVAGPLFALHEEHSRRVLRMRGLINPHTGVRSGKKRRAWE